MTEVTHVFVAGETITAEEVNDNFSDLAAAIDSITTANLDAHAGITSAQIADRYGLTPWTFPLVPVASGDDWSTLPGVSTLLFTMPDAPARFIEHTVTVKPGRRAWCVYAEVSWEDVAVSPANKPEVLVEINSTTFGGAAVPLGDGATTGPGKEFVGNTDPTIPVMPVQNLDLIKISVGSEGSGGTNAQIRGLTVVLWLKEELIP